MFREGRQVKINTSVYEQIRYFFRRNFMENRLKIHEKSGKTGIRNKNRQKCCPWGSLFGIESILGQFLDSGGNPKIIQNLRGLLNQVVSGAIWKQLCAFERLLMDFGSILQRQGDPQIRFVRDVLPLVIAPGPSWRQECRPSAPAAPRLNFSKIFLIRVELNLVF